MATTKTRTPRPARPTGPQPYRFTAEQYIKMGKAGILGEDDRVELIEGILIQMAATGNRHLRVVDSLNMELAHRLYGRAVVSVQSDARLRPSSVPIPDLVVYRPSPDAGATLWTDHEAESVLLIIEVSDTTLRYDLGTKVPVYGRHNIPETWVWNVRLREVHRFREPVDGEYRQHTIARPGDLLDIAMLPGVTVDVAAIFASIR